MSAIADAQQRITRLASLTAVHRAFHWLHLHQPQLRQWQLDLVRIPAPPFGESARAARVLDRFRQLGLANAHLDEAGNVLAEFAPDSDVPGPVVLISAHLDTVFPSGTNCEPIEPPDTPRIYAPGICDNVAGLSGLLAIAAALRHAAIVPPVSILFAANVGEEGEGDLRGMRHLFERSPYAPRIAASIVLEGSGSSAVVTRALGSLRFRIAVTGPGGHSWSDAGVPNPILILARVLLAIDGLRLSDNPLTTINVGSISGGTSINSIPETASALIDLRSTDPDQLVATAAGIRAIVERFPLDLNMESQDAGGESISIRIEVIGDRPAAVLPDDAALLHTIRAVDRHLGLRTDPRLGSTDANIPLSHNIPAIAIGTGGAGGGIHTLQEWYDPTGREAALRRILLTLLDTVQTVVVPAETRDTPLQQTGV